MRLWGGRFSEENDQRVADFTRSIELDRELAADDIAGSIAHVRGLARAGLLTDDELDELVGGLNGLAEAVAAGAIDWDPGARGRPPQPRVGPGRPDRRRGRQAAHRALSERPGRHRPAALARGARSTGWTWRCSSSSARSSGLAEREGTAVLPGTTHIQPAQPVLFAHHLLAYVEMAERDRGRLADARRRANVSPLGSGALAGRGLPARSRGDRGGARVRWGHGQLARRGRRPRFRRRGACGDRPRDGPPEPPRRGDHVVVQPAVRLRPRERRVLDRVVDHAQQEEPGPGRAGPRSRGPGRRRAHRGADAAQGPAARLPARPPGGQGAAVRRGGRVRGEPRRAWRGCSTR